MGRSARPGKLRRPWRAGLLRGEHAASCRGDLPLPRPRAARPSLDGEPPALPAADDRARVERVRHAVQRDGRLLLRAAPRLAMVCPRLLVHHLHRRLRARRLRARGALGGALHVEQALRALRHGAARPAQAEAHHAALVPPRERHRLRVGRVDIRDAVRALVRRDELQRARCHVLVLHAHRRACVPRLRAPLRAADHLAADCAVRVGHAHQPLRRRSLSRAFGWLRDPASDPADRRDHVPALRWALHAALLATLPRPEEAPRCGRQG